MVNRFFLVLPALLLGCAAPSSPYSGWSPPDYAVEPISATSATPSWDGLPTSWSKLTAIEVWLDGSGRHASPGLVTEAELQLAEGRLLLAQRELERIEPKLLTLRLNAAEAGFQRTLARPDLDLHQRERAKQGLDELARIRTGQPTSVAAAGSRGIRTRPSWGAAPERTSRLTRNQAPYSRITVHHSAKPTSDLGAMSAPEVAQALRKIQLVHMRDRGFGDIGYHFLIDPTGRVWQGRSLAWQGAHSDGNNNVANIGICLLGDFDHERPSHQALAALEGLVRGLSSRHRIPRSRVVGHDHWKPTACPGRGLNAWVVAYRTKASAPRTAQ